MRTLTVMEALADFDAILESVVADKAPVLIIRPEGEGVVLVSENEWASIEGTFHL